MSKVKIKSPSNNPLIKKPLPSRPHLKKDKGSRDFGGTLLNLEKTAANTYTSYLGGLAGNEDLIPEFQLKNKKWATANDKLTTAAGITGKIGGLAAGLTLGGPTGLGIAQGIQSGVATASSGIEGDQKASAPKQIINYVKMNENPYGNYKDGGRFRPISPYLHVFKGPKHEKGGIPLLGNEVEGGEAMLGDYIFSNSLGYKPDGTVGETGFKHSFADQAKRLQRKFEGNESPLRKQTKDLMFQLIKQGNNFARTGNPFNTGQNKVLAEGGIADFLPEQQNFSITPPEFGVGEEREALRRDYKRDMFWTGIHWNYKDPAKLRENRWDWSKAPVITPQESSEDAARRKLRLSLHEGYPSILEGQKFIPQQPDFSALPQELLAKVTKFIPEQPDFSLVPGELNRQGVPVPKFVPLQPDFSTLPSELQASPSADKNEELPQHGKIALKRALFKSGSVRPLLKRETGLTLTPSDKIQLAGLLPSLAYNLGVATNKPEVERPIKNPAIPSALQTLKTRRYNEQPIINEAYSALRKGEFTINNSTSSDAIRRSNILGMYADAASKLGAVRLQGQHERNLLAQNLADALFTFGESDRAAAEAAHQANLLNKAKKQEALALTATDLGKGLVDFGRFKATQQTNNFNVGMINGLAAFYKVSPELIMQALNQQIPWDSVIGVKKQTIQKKGGKIVFKPSYKI